MMQTHQTSTLPIVFFDGVCGLCSFFVDFVISRDSQHLFKFSPLQGLTAQKYLNKGDCENLDYIVVVGRKGEILRASKGVAFVLIELGGFWNFLGRLLNLLPGPIANFFYGVVAKHRYTIFGKKDSCRLPTAAERQLFLD